MGPPRFATNFGSGSSKSSPRLDISRASWGVGFDVMPRSFLVLEALYRHTRVQSGPALSAGGYDEGLIQLHLLY